MWPDPTAVPGSNLSLERLLTPCPRPPTLSPPADPVPARRPLNVTKSVSRTINLGLNPQSRFVLSAGDTDRFSRMKKPGRGVAVGFVNQTGADRAATTIIQ